MTETYNLDEYDAPIGAILSLMSGRLVPTPPGNAMVELVRLCEFLIRDALPDTVLRSGHLTGTLRKLCKEVAPEEVISHTYEIAAKEYDSGTSTTDILTKMRERWEKVYGSTIHLKAPVS